MNPDTGNLKTKSPQMPLNYGNSPQSRPYQGTLTAHRETTRGNMVRHNRRLNEENGKLELTALPVNNNYILTACR